MSARARTSSISLNNQPLKQRIDGDCVSEVKGTIADPVLLVVVHVDLLCMVSAVLKSADSGCFALAAMAHQRCSEFPKRVSAQ